MWSSGLTVKMVRTQSLPSVQATRENKAQILIMIKQLSWTLKGKGRLWLNTDRPGEMSFPVEDTTSVRKENIGHVWEYWVVLSGWRTGIHERGLGKKERFELIAECRLYLLSFQTFQNKEAPLGLCCRGICLIAAHRLCWSMETEDVRKDKGTNKILIWKGKVRHNDLG